MTAVTTAVIAEVAAAVTDRLAKTIKAHVAKGDQAQAKAEQHYIAAGQHLKKLKEHHAGSWAEWETLLRNRIGIGKSRASELMQIADGRSSVAEMRAKHAEWSATDRERKTLSPPRGGEFQPDEDIEMEPDNRRSAFLLRAAQAREFATYTGPIDLDVRKAAMHAAEAWANSSRRIGTAFDVKAIADRAEARSKGQSEGRASS